MELDKNISMSTIFGSYRLAKRLESFVLKKAARVLPIRESLGVKAAESGANPEKIKIIPHGIDLSYFNFPIKHDVRKLFNINPNLKLISFVGRLVHENYIRDILDIAKKLSAKRQDFIIVMAGGGKEEKFILDEIKTDPLLAGKVLFIGFQSREVCLDLRRSSEVSLCLMAGFSLIEACAAARPVISYDVEWHSELVINNVTGFLIKEFDTVSATEAINWFFDHPQESEEMGVKAKALAHDRHNLINTSAIKRKYYSEILAQRDNHMPNNHNPIEQIFSGNAWYIDEQFTKQYDRPGSRAVIENRWKIFQEAIALFVINNPDKKIKILDAGCGDGINLLGLHNSIISNGWNAELFGTDYNPIRVERASKLKYVKQVVKSTLNELPFSDGMFDIVLCNHVLEHIPEDKEVLLELKRVVQQGGMLILGVPNEGCFLAWLRNHILQRSILHTTDHVNFYTKKSIINLLVEAGFSVSKVETSGFFLPHFILSYVISTLSLGRKFLQFLGKIWKSQCSDLITISYNKNQN